MRITCVGAGPAGLYFAILAKLRNPAHEVTVIERNGPRQIRGWSLTLGADILEKLYKGDQESARVIERDMFRWREEYLNIRGQRVVHVGEIDIVNMTRPRLVEILADRARELGVQVRYNEEVSSLSQLADADLIVAADGVSSRLRNAIGTFGTEITLAHDKYIWLGTDRPFGALEYFFTETSCGWMWAAGYGVQSDQSTFLIHCTPQTWSGLGFGTMPVVDSLDVVKELFREPLAGYQLMGQADDENSGRWLSFRTVTNQRWHAGNVVLVGDSAHTTHFTTGLGTVTAIGDAIALADSLGRLDQLDLALAAYERQRKAELKPAQDAARLSSEWFADISRYINLNPQAFATVLYARRSPLLTLFPPWLWYQFHRASSKVPVLSRLAVRLYPVARTIGRRKGSWRMDETQMDSGVNGKHNVQMAVTENTEGDLNVKERVVVVGSGPHFASGISHYTYLLTSTLASEYDAGALLMRRLVPKRLYPGRNHVGTAVAGSVVYPPEVSIYDGVDWYWGRSMTRALRYLDEQRPTVVIFEWWTGAVLHTYLRLARHAARLGARIILEWHEGQDIGEAAMPIARRYVRTLMPRLLSLVDAHVVHSEFDLQAIPAAYSLGNAIARVMPHGPYHHVVASTTARDDDSDDSPLRLLYFGVIRPYKGVEDLVEAFSMLDREQASQFRLSVVGETWEGGTATDEAIARSPHADLIERVDRYVSDEELAEYVAHTDAVVLPYHRSSLSGPLFIAMTAGLPTVVTAVGGLVEVVEDYAGAVLVPPQDPVALRDALLKLPARRGERYPNPRSWQQTLEGYRSLIDELSERPGDPVLSFRAGQQAGS